MNCKSIDVMQRFFWLKFVQFESIRVTIEVDKRKEAIGYEVMEM